MRNLIRMDLYRIARTRRFWICLIIAAVLALIQSPFEVIMGRLGKMLSPDAPDVVATATWAEIFGNPFPFMNAMLVLLSVCAFFYEDVENGYIKNIAGQMPKKGYSILSKFVAVIPHNLVFVLVGILCNLIGTVICKQIVPGGDILDSLRIMVLRVILMTSICAIMLFIVSTLQSKSFGTVLAVLFGMGLFAPAFGGILDLGVDALIKDKGFSISSYMPDAQMGIPNPDTVTAIIVAAVTTGLFLWLAIRIFDRKDVK